MTEWGGVLILIATGSTSYKNAAAKRALRNYRSLSEKDGRVLVAMATLDKPATDGASVRYLLRLKAWNIPSLDLTSVAISLVVTEQQCDAACAAIAATGHAIAFDSEYVPVRGAAAAGAGAARKSALVQLCSSKDHVYIFEVMASQFVACLFVSFFLALALASLTSRGPHLQVHKWGGVCFESFAAIMSDESVRKVAHYKGADINPLEARFPTLAVKGVEDLKPIVTAAAKTVSYLNRTNERADERTHNHTHTHTHELQVLPGHGLRDYSKSILRQDMPWKGTVDHGEWEAPTLTKDQKEYAAADALAVHLMVRRCESLGAEAGEEDVEDGEEGPPANSSSSSSSSAALPDDDDDMPDCPAAACSRRRQRQPSASATAEIVTRYSGTNDDGFILADDEDSSGEDSDSDDDDVPEAGPSLLQYCSEVVRRSVRRPR